MKIKVMAEFCGGWLWIDGVGASIEDLLELTPEVSQLDSDFNSWVEEYGDNIVPAEPSPNLDWAAWHSRGIELTKRLQLLIGNKHELRFIYGYEDPAAFGGRPDLIID